MAGPTGEPWARVATRVLVPIQRDPGAQTGPPMTAAATSTKRTSSATVPMTGPAAERAPLTGLGHRRLVSRLRRAARISVSATWSASRV